jgi:hypothetical protein
VRERMEEMKWILLAALVAFVVACFKSKRVKSCNCYLDAVSGAYIDPRCAEKNKK